MQIEVIVGAVCISTPFVVDDVFFAIAIAKAEAPDVGLRLTHEALQNLVDHQAAV